MMTNLLPNLGNLTMKSMEISVQILGGIESGWSVPGALIFFSLIALIGITFDPSIGFGKLGMPN
jgi:hypothetical protein